MDWHPEDAAWLRDCCCHLRSSIATQNLEGENPRQWRRVCRADLIIKFRITPRLQVRVPTKPRGYSMRHL